MATKKSGLGKGLEALFADNQTNDIAPSTVRISEIEPNKDQPRRNFSEEALNELAESIREHGILQPLVVRPLESGMYQIVAGERRWRAARIAGLREVPVIIRTLSDAEAMEQALIENLQREDLDPVEEAKGYQRLMDTYSLTQEQVSQKVGKSRPTVANALRLLSLSEEVLRLIEQGAISSGHGRALLALPEEDRLAVAKEITEKGLSVRQVEGMKPRSPKSVKKEPKKNWGEDHYFEEVALALSEDLHKKVSIQGKGKKAELRIRFQSKEELDELVAKLTK